MTSRASAVTVTPDGRSHVDIAALFAKPHIQAMLEAMRAKIADVRRKP